MSVEVERSIGIDYFRKFDYFLMGMVITISAFGLVFLHSAIYTLYEDGGSKALTIQIVGIILGLIFSLIICFFDYSNFKNIWPTFYLINIFLMLLVFVPGIGVDAGGSKSWIKLFGITTYQPSELMKLAVIIVVAKYLEKINEDGMQLKYVTIVFASFIIPLCLVFIQKDIGTALVFTFVFMVMLFVGRIKIKYISGLIGAGFIGIFFVWKFLLNNTRQQRFYAYLDPEKYAGTYGFQLLRGMQAIGSGQFSGKGIGEGPMNVANLIPVKESDMIFAVICEEMGFIGGMFVIIIMTAFLIRMIYISSKSRDMFGSLIAAGVFAMFAFNIVENIGMNVGIMPITGLPLPLISRGGSAMVTNFIAIGLVLSISMRRRIGLFSDE